MWFVDDGTRKERNQVDGRLKFGPQRQEQDPFQRGNWELCKYAVTQEKLTD